MKPVIASGLMENNQEILKMLGTIIRKMKEKSRGQGVIT
jgi:hypothetical protein